MPELSRLVWEEARDALARAHLALLPVGSCEQHGPHGTLDTDSAIAEAFARRLATDLGEDAVLCPPLRYGLSEHHLDFPGTLTLRPATFIALVADVVESLAHWNLRRVLVVNGHGGNIDALRLAAREARRDRGALVASVIWAQLAADEIANATNSPRHNHACEIETSLAMALAPETVRADRIGPPGDLAQLDRAAADPLTDPPAARADRPIWFAELTSTGALGDARRASAELGRSIAETAYARALEFARGLCTQPLPSTGPRSTEM